MLEVGLRRPGTQPRRTPPRRAVAAIASERTRVCGVLVRRLRVRRRHRRERARCARSSVTSPSKRNGSRRRARGQASMLPNDGRLRVERSGWSWLSCEAQRARRRAASAPRCAGELARGWRSAPAARKDVTQRPKDPSDRGCHARAPTASGHALPRHDPFVPDGEREREIAGDGCGRRRSTGSPREAARGCRRARRSRRRRTAASCDGRDGSRPADEYRR